MIKKDKNTEGDSTSSRTSIRNWHKRLKLWTPFAKVHIISGVLNADGDKCTTQSGINDVLAEHWSKVFEHKVINKKAAESFLKSHCVKGDFCDAAPPSSSSILYHLRQVKNSAPGID